MLLNDNLQSEIQNIIEDCKGSQDIKQLNKFAAEMEEIIVGVNTLVEGLEEYLDASLYQEWELIYTRIIEQVEQFSGYIAEDYGGPLDTIAMNERENLDDTGNPNFGDKIDEVAQQVFEDQEEKKVKALELILEAFDAE